MPSLQVRELPENIYRLLQDKATAEHRSLAQEAIVSLGKGLQTSLSNKHRRKKLLKKILDNQGIDPTILRIDPADMLREDRSR
jgi:plasmid stability protein